MVSYPGKTGREGEEKKKKNGTLHRIMRAGTVRDRFTRDVYII